MAAEVKIAQFKSRLSEYLRSVRRGHEIIIKDRETPIARVVPYKEPAKRLVTIPPTRSLKEVEEMLRRLKRPKNLRPGDVDQALREERRDRFDDWL
jgi:prevent-host-death family protein